MFFYKKNAPKSEIYWGVSFFDLKKFGKLPSRKISTQSVKREIFWKTKMFLYKKKAPKSEIYWGV
ncbi:MAG: hypothetical protein RL757_3059 [Bacteroidota bacterium]|jgi:hypothetical protein